MREDGIFYPLLRHPQGPAAQAGRAVAPAGARALRSGHAPCPPGPGPALPAGLPASRAGHTNAQPGRPGQLGQAGQTAPTWQAEPPPAQTSTLIAGFEQGPAKTPVFAPAPPCPGPVPPGVPPWAHAPAQACRATKSSAPNGPATPGPLHARPALAFIRPARASAARRGQVCPWPPPIRTGAPSKPPMQPITPAPFSAAACRHFLPHMPKPPEHPFAARHLQHAAALAMQRLPCRNGAIRLHPRANVCQSTRRFQHQDSPRFCNFQKQTP